MNKTPSSKRLGEFLEKLKPLNAELNPICHLLALLGVHHFLHVSRIRVKTHYRIVTQAALFCMAVVNLH